ncbi:MAG: UDP-N-acetylmuramoyl-tripeptide--D-alanyl-D-alanine ligase [Bacillota bacterium]
MKLSVHEIVEAVNGQLLYGNGEGIITGISIDSRTVKDGELFIPIIGEKYNGSHFISHAFQAGAKAAFITEGCEDAFEDDKYCLIKVEDTLKAFHQLAAYYLNRFNIPIVAVTGSTGKTSTKDMIYAVLSQKYKVLKNAGNLNNHIGLPITVFQLEQGHEAAIFEMGMSSLGEIDRLANIVKPHIGVITNVGLSHIEHLGSQENIFKAKMEIATYMKEKNTLIVNGDDKYLRTLRRTHLDYKIVYAGLEENNDLMPLALKDCGEHGTIFQIEEQGKVYDFSLRVPGIHNVYNALCAIVVGKTLGVEMHLIQKGLQEFEGSSMRLSITNTKMNVKLINDAYNASPDSMKAALSVLSKINSLRKIAILGDMLEMGEQASPGHYAVGAEAAKYPIDMLIAVGRESVNIGRGAIASGLTQGKVIFCEDNREAITVLDDFLQAGDAVLVKGSRGMKMETICTYIQERSSMNDTV